MSDTGFDPERCLAPRQTGRAVWCHFDPAWYLLATPELAAELDDTSPDALRRHYLESGAAAGLSPNMFFDEGWYRLRYPAIAEDIAAGRLASGYAHYCATGYLTHTPHWLYDEDSYAASAADLTEAALAVAGCVNLYDHYLRAGAAEGRGAHPLFDPASLSDGGANPFERFLQHAWATGEDQRVSPYFDPAWFRARYPHIAAEIDAGHYACALHAYLCRPGAPHDPLEQFSEQFYRTSQREAAAAIAAGAVLSGYEYFLKFGVFALHAPTPGIDLAGFLDANPDLAAAIAEGRLRDAFAGLLQRPAPPAPPPAPVPEARPAAIATLPLLRRRVFVEIEAAIICPPDGLAVTGWTLSPPGALAAIHLHSGPRRTELVLSRAIRTPRPDVRDSIGAEHGLADTLDSGFIAHLPGAWQPDAETRLRVETSDGEIGERALTPSRLGGLEAIRFLAERADLRYGAVPPAFDSVLGPSIATLNAERLATRPRVETIAFGPPPAAPALSVIVALYGRLDFLEYQFARFSCRAPAFPVEYLYVLDDPGLRRNAEALAASVWQRFRIPFRLLLLDRNMGYAPANNIGLAHARGDTVCFLNSDVFPATPDWMERLAARLADHPELGAVGPLLLFEDGSVQHQGMRFETVPLLGNWHFPQHIRKGWRPPAEGGLVTADAITGACLMMRRDLALELGGFDEAYPIGDFEDSDLCLKLRARGLGVAVDLDTRLHHLERQSQAGGGQLWRRNLTLFNAWLHERRWAATLAELDASCPGC